MKFAILARAIYLQIDNMTALTYLVEMRWETYSSYGTSENIQGEYLPTSPKIYANWKSRKYQNLSDWDLNLQISFLKLWKSEEFVGLSAEPSVTKIHVTAAGPKEFSSEIF